ncbi:MAG: universal stress protein [Gammaproteobacteria bacterium]
MSIKDILVHVNASPGAPSRVETAARLAQSQQARLAGLYVVTPLDIPDHIRAQLSSEVIERQQQAAEQMAEQCRETFTEIAAKFDIEPDWTVAHGDLSRQITRQTRYYDLVVLGQHGADNDVQPGSGKLPDSVVLASGRPVMIVPGDAPPREVGRDLLVAWDGSRQAVRAISDNLPLLVSAQRVVVLVVNTHGARRQEEIELTGANISRHLNRHGVHAEPIQVQAKEHNVGQAILGQAAETGSDAIVMGAWGHQKWQEMILGGVTRFMLEHADRPVIMSH